MKLGVFGGTFDPIHIGHLIMAGEARSCLGLDQVLFIPAGQPWFKTDGDVTSAHHRLSMVKGAIASNSAFRVSDIEVSRLGPSYTVETLEELKSGHGPEVEMYIIAGLDALAEVTRWRRPERVLELATPVGFARPGCDKAGLRALDKFQSGASKRAVVINSPLIDISGTEIRRRVSEGFPIKYWVPEAVEAYIYQHGLYVGS